MYIPYTSSVIGRVYNGSVIQYWRSCTPSRSIGECAVPGLNAILCFLWFTNCVLLFDKNLILGCLWHLIFVLNNILILGIWCSTIPHLPGCFCPWTFFFFATATLSIGGKGTYGNVACLLVFVEYSSCVLVDRLSVLAIGLYSMAQ